MRRDIRMLSPSVLFTTLSMLSACAEPRESNGEIYAKPPAGDESESDGGESTGAIEDPPPLPGGSESSDSGPDGNLPCEGCAGDVCGSNDECLDGFLCARLNDEVAWCSNCNAVFSCESTCTADVNCGVDGVCHEGLCWHGCASDDDCPDGHECKDDDGQRFCAPADLPALDEECVTSAAGWCEAFVEGEGTCVYTGTDFQSDPGENWCTKACTSNTDCTDVWPLGCCSADGVFGEGGGNYCLRPEWAASCM